jgi:hypothetical protein
VENASIRAHYADFGAFSVGYNSIVKSLIQYQ